MVNINSKKNLDEFVSKNKDAYLANHSVYNKIFCRTVQNGKYNKI